MTRTTRRLTALAVASLAVAAFAGTASVAQAFPTRTNACTACHTRDTRIVVTATQNAVGATNATYGVSVSNQYGDGMTSWAVFDGAINIRNGYGAGTFSVPVGKTYTVFGVAGNGGQGANYVSISPVAPPPVDTAPPTVSLTAPTGGATVSGSVALAATAADAMSGVARVEFRVDGVLVGTDVTAPYAGTWNASGATVGLHTIQATAVDGAGLSASTSLLVSIAAPPPPVDTAPPTVSLTAPTGGATVSGSVALAATAADAMSGVARVEFRVDGVLVGTDVTAPYAGTWNASGATVGLHTIQATAVDGAGLSAVSSVQVSIASPPPPPPTGSDTVPPTVSITAPADDAHVSGSVTIAATAADAGSGVARVEFRVDGVLVGTDFTAPYAILWNASSAVAEEYQIKATAFDNAGLSSNHEIEIEASGQRPVVRTSALTITARTRSGSPAARVWLTVRNTKTGMRYSARTATDGTARFSSLPYGRYVVATVYGGYRGSTKWLADSPVEALRITVRRR